MNSLWEVISQIRRDSSMVEEWKRKRKKNVKPFQRLFFILRPRLTLGKRNKFSTILSPSLPPLSFFLLIRPHLLKPLFFRLNHHESFRNNVVWYRRTGWHYYNSADYEFIMRKDNTTVVDVRNFDIKKERRSKTKEKVERESEGSLDIKFRRWPIFFRFF